MTAVKNTGAGRYFGLVLILSLPFYALGITGLALPFASALPLSAVMAVVPTIAAVVLVYRHGGREDVRAFLTTAFDFRGIKSAGWIIASGFMPLAFALTTGLVWLFGTPLPTMQLLPLSTFIVAFAMLFIGALGEEFGWQGYAYPALVKHHSALTAALVIGIVWALWHVIPFALMGRDAAWIFWQALGMVMLRIIIVWLFAITRQSILIAAMFHMMSNSPWGVFANFDPYYDPQFMFEVLLASTTACILLWGPFPRMHRRLTLWVFGVLLIGVVVSSMIRVGCRCAACNCRTLF